MQNNTITLIHTPRGVQKCVLTQAVTGTGKSIIVDLYNEFKKLMGEIEEGEMGGPHPKYKFSRNNWYMTERTMNHDLFAEQLAWCTQHFGPEPKEHDAWSRWYSWFNCIKFRDSKDYEWYMLRWS
jgi:hypothetical protein